jgi:hypothetical protein
MIDSLPPAVKDDENAHPVAGAWRRTLRDIVQAFAEGDFALSRGVRHVRPVNAETAEHLRSCVTGYGATLTPLPEEAWNTSVAQWYGGFWDVLVDLWTAEEGRSDMVLDARIYEVGDHFEIQIHFIYVP